MIARLLVCERGASRRTLPASLHDLVAPNLDRPPPPPSFLPSALLSVPALVWSNLREGQTPNKAPSLSGEASSPRRPTITTRLPSPPATSPPSLSQHWLPSQPPTSLDLPYARRWPCMRLLRPSSTCLPRRLIRLCRRRVVNTRRPTTGSLAEASPPPSQPHHQRPPTEGRRPGTADHRP